MYFYKARLYLVCIIIFISTISVPINAQVDEVDFSIAESYGVGERKLDLVDTNRDNRELTVWVWYPTEPPSRVRSYITTRRDAPILESDAPYPLVIYSVGACLDARSTQQLGLHLVTHGFVVISAQHFPAPPDPSQCAGEDPSSIVNRPMDVTFMLDEIEVGNFSDFSEMIDLERVGMSGYSYGGYATVISAGARVHESALSEFCSNYNDKLCGRMLSEWENVTSLYQSFGETDESGWWIDLADPRIDVIAASAPCFVPVMSETGLESLNVPSLIFSVSGDQSCSPERNASKVFENSPASERYWLNWTGEMENSDFPKHIAFLYQDTVIASVLALETAFFYTHLIEDSDFSAYLNSFPALDDWEINIGS